MRLCRPDLNQRVQGYCRRKAAFNHTFELIHLCRWITPLAYSPVSVVQEERSNMQDGSVTIRVTLDTYTQAVTTEKRNAQEAVVALSFREKTQET